MWFDEQGDQPEHEAIERSEIRGALSGTIGDEHLLLEQQRLGGNGTGAARAEEFRDGYEKVNREEQQIAHGPHRITPEIVRKTVR